MVYDPYFQILVSWDQAIERPQCVDRWRVDNPNCHHPIIIRYWARVISIIIIVIIIRYWVRVWPEGTEMSLGGRHLVNETDLAKKQVVLPVMMLMIMMIRWFDITKVYWEEAGLNFNWWWWCWWWNPGQYPRPLVNETDVAQESKKQVTLIGRTNRFTKKSYFLWEGWRFPDLPVSYIRIHRRIVSPILFSKTANVVPYRSSLLKDGNEC